MRVRRVHQHPLARLRGTHGSTLATELNECRAVSNYVLATFGIGLLTDGADLQRLLSRDSQNCSIRCHPFDHRIANLLVEIDQLT